MRHARLRHGGVPVLYRMLGRRQNGPQVRLGRIGEARTNIQALLAIKPTFSITEARKFYEHLPDIENHIAVPRQQDCRTSAQYARSHENRNVRKGE